MGKLPYLTGPSKEKRFRFQASITEEDAPEISNALSAINAERPGETMALSWCLAMKEIGVGIEVQRCNAHALEILNAPISLPWNTEELLKQIEDAVKALEGWPTINRIEFVAEDSPEHAAWKEEQDND